MSEVTPLKIPATYKWSTLLLGVLLAFSMAWVAYEQRLQRVKEQFTIDTETTFQSIVKNLTTADAMLDALVGLNLASDEMDPTLFTPFSETILQQHPYIRSIQYLSNISLPEKDDFITQMHESGFSQFTIKNIQEDVTGMSDQKRFLITSFIEPLTPTSAKFMGVDWSGHTALRNRIEESVQENRVAIMHAPQEMKGFGQILLIKPTYFGRTISESAQQRGNEFSGLFLLLLDWRALIEQFDPQDINALKVHYEMHAISQLEQVPNDELLQENGSFIKQREIRVGECRVGVTARYHLKLAAEDTMAVVVSAGMVIFIYVLMVLILRNRYLAKLEKKAVQQQLFEERELAHVTLGSIAEAVITVDDNSDINYMNSVAEKLLQCELNHAQGKPLKQYVRLMDLATSRILSDPVSYFVDTTISRKTLSGTDIALNIDGKTLSVDGNASPLLDVNGDSIGNVLVLRDVSLERQLTNELVYQASHDALTGLVNRVEFENKLKEMLENSRQNDTQHAMCYLDMDQFKLINDTCGHIAGDDLLKQVAGLLLFQMREDDLVARLGGDEFGVLIHSCNEHKAMEIAERIRQCLNDYHFKWQDKVFDVSASIGLVMINRLSENLSTLLSSADLACYAAKDSGRNIVHQYRSDDEEISVKFSQMQWLPRIKEALLNDEFSMALQRISANKDGLAPQTIFEFLLRWPQEDGSFVSPALFIPSAERYDLMRDVDRWVINHALRVIPRLEKLAPQGGDNMYTINLSGQSVGDQELTNFILSVFERTGVDPQLVCFEITETVAIANFSVASEFIKSLRDKGCRFALDDFGSGLSSFGYLKRLPLDFLKIDGLFVRDMLQDPVDLAMVRTIHDVARVLKLQTIAEWVEDEQVHLALKDIGVDYAQGFYVEKPRLLSDIL